MHCLVDLVFLHKEKEGLRATFFKQFGGRVDPLLPRVGGGGEHGS